jgi:hypothetical protein
VEMGLCHKQRFNMRPHTGILGGGLLLQNRGDTDWRL